MTRLILTTDSERSEGVQGTPSSCGHGAGDLRCACGSLLARVVGGEIELKCRRCKRTWRIPIAEGA